MNTTIREMQSCCIALRDKLEDGLANAIGIHNVTKPDQDDPDRDGEYDYEGLLQRVERLSIMVRSLQDWARNQDGADGPIPRDAELLRALLIESRVEPDMRRAYARIKRRRDESRAAAAADDPWWAIIDPGKLGSRPHDDAEAALCGYITGPFFIESDAEAHFAACRYAFSADAKIVELTGEGASPCAACVLP